MSDGTELVAGDELLYWRVPASQGWYQVETKVLSRQAFAPHRERDTTGISVYRAKYKSIEEAAQGQPDKTYYVAVMRAGDLRDQGIGVVARPSFSGQHDPGNAELPNLRSDNRKTDAVLEFQQMLATNLCISVEGPFPPAEG